MIEEIKKKLPEHILINTSSENIYIVDYKNLNGGEVELLEKEPEDIKFIHIENPNKINVTFDGFKDNALPIDIGVYNSQCECVLFPESNQETDWILFIEAKYANDFLTLPNLRHS